jgi:hypothetical protein
VPLNYLDRELNQTAENWALPNQLVLVKRVLLSYIPSGNTEGELIIIGLISGPLSHKTSAFYHYSIFRFEN